MRTPAPTTHHVIDLTTDDPPVAGERETARLVVALLTVWLSATGLVTALWWSSAGWS
jgi:hypothetical protein